MSKNNELTYEQQIKKARKMRFELDGKFYNYDQLTALLQKDPSVITQIAIKGNLNVDVPKGFLVIASESATGFEAINYIVNSGMTTTENEPLYVPILESEKDQDSNTYTELIERADTKPVYFEENHNQFKQAFQYAKEMRALEEIFKDIQDDLDQAEDEATMTFETDMHMYDPISGRTGFIKAGTVLPFDMVEDCTFFDEAKDLQAFLRQQDYGDNCDCAACKEAPDTKAPTVNEVDNMRKFLSGLVPLGPRASRN